MASAKFVITPELVPPLPAFPGGWCQLKGVV